MPADRNLHWDGCHNVRDLGGLRVRGGVRTRWGAIVRADAPDTLTEAGWSALWDHGIRTVIDLREKDEPGPAAALRPAELEIVHLPLDDLNDVEFWDTWGSGLDCTPLYYRAFLERFPDRIAAVLNAVAAARPGGVLINCAAGRDRTGLVVLVLLALAGVDPEDIAADHGLSNIRLKPVFAALGIGDQAAAIDRILARHGTTARTCLLATLAWFDAEPYLRAAGLGAETVAALRARLLVADSPAEQRDRRKRSGFQL
jgi:protein-tyrosine phosphatase